MEQQRPRVQAPGFDADALRNLLKSTRVTPVVAYLARGRTLEDFRGALWMYLDRYTRTGDLAALAKAILKAESLREHFRTSGTQP